MPAAQESVNVINMNRQAFIVSFAGWLLMAGPSPAAPGLQSEQNAGRTGGVSVAAALLPSGDQVIRRMMDRSAALAAATNAPAWAYDKRMLVEKLDGDARVEERTEKLYRVRIIRGVPFSRLVGLSGRDLTEAELRRENEREASFQKQLSGRDPKKAVRQREAFITKDMIDRFEYKVLRRETVRGRQTLLVSFEPRPGRDGGSFQDRLLSRLAGMFWVDEEMGDVARLQVRLTEGFSMGWLGVLGSIKECRMNLESKPMPDGTWLPEKTTMAISARMFLSSVRFRMEETSSNFKLEAATEPDQP